MNEGKKLPGVIMYDAEEDGLVFTPFGKSKRKKDRTIKVLEHGWLKESAQRVKFFSSVKKTLGASRVYQAMDDDLFEAMQVLNNKK